MKKIISSLLIFTLIVSWLASCEKESLDQATNNNDSEINVSYLQIKDINSSKVIEKIQKIIEKQNELKIEKSGSILDFIILTDNIAYIENGKHHSYTFPIVKYNKSNDNIENLVLKLNDQGEYDAFIMSYDFNASELENFTEEDIKSRNVSYTKIDIDSDNILDDIKKSYTICVETWMSVGLVSPRTFEVSSYIWVLVDVTCTSVSGGSGGGGGGGNYDPTDPLDGGGDGGSGSGGGSSSGGSNTNDNPADINTTPVPTPELSPLTLFDLSSLNDTQKELFYTALQELMDDCLGKALVQSVEAVKVTMGATTGGGNYYPDINTIKFATNGDIEAGTLGSELFHAYQQQLYGTLSAIYSGIKSTGGSNMEAEEKAFNIQRDLLYTEDSTTDDNGLSVGRAIGVNDEQWAIRDWLVELAFNHPTGSIVLNQSELDSWFDALEEFQQYHAENNPDTHYGDPVDYNQKPDAIINLTNKARESNCN